MKAGESTRNILEIADIALVGLLFQWCMDARGQRPIRKQRGLTAMQRIATAMNRNDGGAAFPLMYDDRSCQVGISMRDYFAAAAVQGLVIHWQPETAAEIAYKIADAMLKARDA